MVSCRVAATIISLQCVDNDTEHSSWGHEMGEDLCG
jgi:hypothetical protein